MPGKLHCVTALVLLLALCGIGFRGQAVVEAPLSASFADGAADHIRSDGNGAYQNGVDGVQALLDLLDDFILQLHFAGKKNLPRRQMCFDFTEPVPGSGSGAINRGTFCQDAFLNVDSIGTLPEGQSRLAHAQFNTQVGLLRFNSAYPGASDVLVTRTSATTWIITAAGAGGDVAALVQQTKNNTYKQVGNYRMPFQILVQLQ